MRYNLSPGYKCFLKTRTRETVQILELLSIGRKYSETFSATQVPACFTSRLGVKGVASNNLESYILFDL